MSYINNEGIAPTIQLDSVGIGLQLDSIGNAINVDKLDLNSTEYLVVGEKNYEQSSDYDMKNAKWSFLINQQGVAINTSRNVSSNFLTPDTSLFVDDNIYCTGIIKATGLELNNIVLDSDPLTSSLIRDFIINANNISVNQPFQTGTHTNYEDVYEVNYQVKNVFTTSFVTLGGYVDTYENTHPLNIVSTANNKFNSMHIAIRNDVNNEEEACKFAMGIIGGSNISPAIISTTKGIPLEFHVSKSSSMIDEIYGSNAIPFYTREEQYPAMTIDDRNNVAIGINKTSTKSYTKNTLNNGIVTGSVVTQNAKLEVNGLSCFDDVLVYDYVTNSHKILDDIYVRNNGISVINSTQISAGDFLGEFYNFNRITVNSVLNANDFVVENNVNIKNELKTETLIVNNVANFSGLVQFDYKVEFNNAEEVSIKKLKIDDDIYIGSKKIIPIDIDDPATGYGTYSRSEDGSNYFFVYVHSNIATLDANCNISFPKKMAIGLTENDGFDGILNVIKTDETTSNNFDITLKSTIMDEDYYANIGRLSRLDHVDNSLIINTNRVSGKENNIYFYPETNMSEITSNYFLPNIRNTPPTLSLHNGSVSINKLSAREGFEFDVDGKVAAKEYHLSIDNEMHRLSSFVYQTKNYFNLSDYYTDKFCINYNTLTAFATNMKGLNVKKGINADDYYRNDKIVETLQNANSPNEFYTNKKISIGWQGEDINVPLQIRNLTTEDYNYSIIRIYRGIRGGGLKNNADYSGIDFCEYDRDLGSDRNAERWFIYKNHTYGDVDARNIQRVGPLQIGYIDKDVKPSTYGMTFYYNTENSKYHIDVNKPEISHSDIDSAMSVYGDLEVHGDIKILDYNGCNYNFKLQNISSLAEITQYIKTVETYGDNIPDGQDPGYETLNNDISYTGHNLLYMPNKSVVVDPVFDSNIPFVVKQDNSNLATSKFITYADGSLECSSFIELAIYDSNQKIADDNYEKTDNINNMIRFNLSTDDAKTTKFDMSFYHNDYYKRFFTFRNRLDDFDNILGSTTHVGIGTNIDNNSNIAFHIDDINKFGLQITNDERSPAINLLHTGATCNIYHTIRGGSFDNNYNFSIDVANTSEYNEPDSKEVFIIDAFDGNKLRHGARFGFNDTTLNESFAIKTDYNTSAMSITSRYTQDHIFNSLVTILPENTELLKMDYNWSDESKSYSATFNYNITTFPNVDDDNNPITEANKSDPEFTFATNVELDSNFTYKTIHSNLTISYNSSNLNYDNKAFNDPLVDVVSTSGDLVETTLQYQQTTYNNLIEPNLVLVNHDFIPDDMVVSEHVIDLVIESNLDLIDDIASNYKFNYEFKLVSRFPDYINCNITNIYDYNTASNIAEDRNMIYIKNKIYTDILPFDQNEYYFEFIEKNVYLRDLFDNGIYENVFLESETSNILRINSNLDFTGKFIAERDNYINYTTTSRLPNAFVNPTPSENSIEYMYNTVIDEQNNSNIYISTSNYAIYNNVNSTPRDVELVKLTENILLEDSFTIFGNDITTQVYLTEYFNKLQDAQDENYLIRVRNYNYNNYKPHITLANNIESLNIIEGHQIYSYDGIFEIRHVNSVNNSTWVPFKIDAYGNATIRGGIFMEGDMRFDGKIYDSNGNDLIEILNKNYYKEYEINSSNIHFNSYGSNGVEINGRASHTLDDYKYLYIKDYSDFETFEDVMVLHKRHLETPQFKLDLYGDLDTSNGILRVEGRDIIRDTCNYTLLSSNIISNRITDLNTDHIAEELNSHNKFIVDHKYNDNLEVNGNLTINSNLIVLGDETRLNTEIYTTEQLEIENNDTDVALKVTQTGNHDIVNIFNNTTEVFTILYNGNVGINAQNPLVALEINDTDGIKIPVGDDSQRPTDGKSGAELSDYTGNIRYNTDLNRFEGFGQNNKWMSLSGLIDENRDTFIKVEDNAGDNNDEIKFVSSGFERMVIKDNGFVGVNNISPSYNLDLIGYMRVSSNLYVTDRIGINNENPLVALEINATDGIKIPVGDDSQRPTYNIPDDELSNYTGNIRYNTNLERFEGFGQNNEWMSLSGLIDEDRDTYIKVEDNAGDDNDEINFFSSGFERMVIKDNGFVGVNNVAPSYNLDLIGFMRISSNLYVTDRIGINNENPLVALEINATDGIKIPVGDDIQRPTYNMPVDELLNYTGNIRYNTNLERFEGFGQNNKWMSLSGLIDEDRDTYIKVEDNAGDNNNEIKFVSSGGDRMIIKADGFVGVNNVSPSYNLDLIGYMRVSSNLYVTDRVGINNENPLVALEINATDGIKIPVGDDTQRPTYNMPVDELFNYTGNIRYNTNLERFEGFGQNNEWMSLSGLIDEDRDTYIKVEDNAGDDNDEINFFSSGFERMVIKDNGFVGVNNISPSYNLDLIGYMRVSSNLYVTDRIGINNENPYVGLDVNTVDGIKIPRGDTSQRPTKDIISDAELDNHKGYIRYNTELEQFEGFGPGNKWGSLGGVKDVDGDTYILAENDPGTDNDELKFYTDSNARMIVDSQGKVGIGTMNPAYVFEVIGGVNIKTDGGAHIFTIDDRDIIQETCNYVTQSSNFISNRITALNTDHIAEELDSHNKFIVDHKYNDNLEINGNLTINSNLIVLGDETRLNTEIYTTEQLEVENNDTDVALKVTQTGNEDIVNIFNNTTEVFTILYDGKVGINNDAPSYEFDLDGYMRVSSNLYVTRKVGINNENPYVGLDVNTVDGIKIPRGVTDERPTKDITSDAELDNHKGYIRYNTELEQFEGFGPGNKWGSLGGVKDVDGDTYILAENDPGTDNDELKFYTDSNARMIVDSQGNVGIGTMSPAYVLEVIGGVNIKTDGGSHIFTIDDRDIIQETCNYVTQSSNLISNRITALNTDHIAEELESHNKFIVDHRYNDNLEVNGNLTINSNLIVLGDETRLNTEIYTTQQLEVENNDTDVALKVTQTGIQDIVNIFNNGSNVFTILHNGNVGINNVLPLVSLDINTSNSIKLPLGDVNSRPTNGVDPTDLYKYVGNIRYNGELGQFEGFGAGNQWGSLGGVKDVDGDTYISAETTAGTDNDELKFYTKNTSGSDEARMIITNDGLIGIGTEVPNKHLTLNKYNATLSIHDSQATNIASTSIELINGINNEFDNNELQCGWKISNSNNQYLITSGSNNIVNDRFTIDGLTGNIGIGTEPHIYQSLVHQDEFKLNVVGSLNIEGDIYRDGELFTVGNIIGSDAMGVASQNMTIQTLSETYTKTKVMSENNAQNTTADNGWRFIDNDLNNGFIIKIRPSHRTSKILLNLSCHIGFDSSLDSRWWGLKLYRKIDNQNWTEVKAANGNYDETTNDNGNSADVGGSTACWVSHNLGSSLSSYENFVANVSGIFCDSPDTRKDVYYTVKWKSRLGDTTDPCNGDLYLNRPAIYNSGHSPVLSSSWVAQELWQLGTPFVPAYGSNIITMYNNDYVGIGNTEPEYVLDVNGDIKTTSNLYIFDKIGINTHTPEFSIDVRTTDGIKIPSGSENDRPSAPAAGVIRYNTDSKQFEGYGITGEWGSLGGVKDVDGNTYISAEDNPGDDNNELKFYTESNLHMIIDNVGNVGVGKETPVYKVDVDGVVNASSYNIDGVPFRLEFPKGMTLQTKHLTYTDTRTKSDTATDWVPVDNDLTTGFVIRVKPTHTTSKVLLNLVCHIGMDYLQDSRWWGLKLFRKIGTGNWTEVVGANGTGSNNGSACWISHNLGAESSIYSHSITNVTGSYEDEPQTTDDVYYTIYWKSRLDGSSGRLYLNKSAETYDDNYPKPSSSWSATEIWHNGVPYIPPVSSSIISLSGNNVGIDMIPAIDSSYKLEVNGNLKCNSLFQTSDKRYKNNIKALESALNLIEVINPVSYTTSDTDQFKYGFIAQELENIIPDVVNTPRDKNELYSIDYISMIPLLTKSIQELSNIINIQQKEINELKANI